jgi:chorismate synthase
VVARKIMAPAKVQASILEVGGSSDLEKALDQAMADQDSIGGIIECRITEVPVGLGEPFFDSLEAVMSHMVFSIPAIKGIEFGSGFGAARMRGSEHNDNIVDARGGTETNHAGGINGGISQRQRDYVPGGGQTHLQHPPVPADHEHAEREVGSIWSMEGRHDTCIALRVPVVVEAAAAIVMADFMLQAQEAGSELFMTQTDSATDAYCNCRSRKHGLMAGGVALPGL